MEPMELETVLDNVITHPDVTSFSVKLINDETITRGFYHDVLVCLKRIKPRACELDPEYVEMVISKMEKVVRSGEL
jgi:hypothetical protein